MFVFAAAVEGLAALGEVVKTEIIIGEAVEKDSNFFEVIEAYADKKNVSVARAVERGLNTLLQKIRMLKVKKLCHFS